MALLTLHGDNGYRHFDEEECGRAGAALHDQYVAAHPFQHIVIDDFIDPALLRDVAANYPTRDGKSFFDRAQERLKYQYHGGEIPYGPTRLLLAELNSRAFIKFLRELTGIKGLISDPYFEGGGLHETLSGGHLSVHADFNIHSKMKVERRLNLLIYLNDDWPESYGGHLELWDKGMTAPVHRIAPVLGRAVIFNTALDSYHGQPDPVQCSPERSRRSIATYYYTAFETGVNVPTRTTNFRARPQTGDQADRSIAYQHFLNDWIPHRLHGIARRFNPWR